MPGALFLRAFSTSSPLKTAFVAVVAMPPVAVSTLAMISGSLSSTSFMAPFIKLADLAPTPCATRLIPRVSRNSPCPLTSAVTPLATEVVKMLSTCFLSSPVASARLAMLSFPSMASANSVAPASAAPLMAPSSMDFPILPPVAAAAIPLRPALMTALPTMGAAAPVAPSASPTVVA